MISWAFECYEKGLITKEDTGGLELTWGNGYAMVKMAEKIAYRDGLGDILADGVKEASRRIGKGSEAFAIHVKGVDSVDPYRAGKGFGFGVSISPIGGRHLRGAVSNPEVTGPRGLKWSIQGTENIPEAVYWQSKSKEIEDMLGFCVYLGTWSGTHSQELEDYADLVSGATGIEFSVKDLQEFAKRGLNLEKAFNTLFIGISRESDYPPQRYMDEPIKNGPFKGVQCDKEEWELMLDRFYTLNGWDRSTGWQSRESLNALKLGDIADKLERVGRLGGSSL